MMILLVAHVIGSLCKSCILMIMIFLLFTIFIGKSLITWIVENLLNPRMPIVIYIYFVLQIRQNLN